MQLPLHFMLLINWLKWWFLFRVKVNRSIKPGRWQKWKPTKPPTIKLLKLLKLRKINCYLFDYIRCDTDLTRHFGWSFGKHITCFWNYLCNCGGHNVWDVMLMVPSGITKSTPTLHINSLINNFGEIHIYVFYI